mgnify:FL=1
MEEDHDDTLHPFVGGARQHFPSISLIFDEQQQVDDDDDDEHDNAMNQQLLQLLQPPQQYQQEQQDTRHGHDEDDALRFWGLEAMAELYPCSFSIGSDMAAHSAHRAHASFVSLASDECDRDDLSTVRHDICCGI